MKLDRLSIVQKLLFGFGAILAVIVASSSFLIFELQRTSDIERINSLSSAAIDYFDEANSRLNAARAEAIRFVTSGIPGDREKIKPELDGFEQNLDRVDAILKADAPELLEDLSKYRSAAHVYVEKTMGEEVKLAADPVTRPQAVHIIVAGLAHEYVVASHKAARTARDHIEAWSTTWTRKGRSAMAQMFWAAVGSGLISLFLGVILMRAISRSISRPINGMAQAMGRLAAGDLAIAVPGLGEGHEIGGIASAVQVFKESAVEKRRLEAEVAEKARAVEAERAQNEAQNAATAAEQARVVATIAEGLDSLAKGRLNHRIETSFPAGYERLRVDFNLATEKLLGTMLVVARNTSAIGSGTKEIATASDDLSLRTEQQAAALEETAAALAQLTEMVNKTSSGAQDARDLVLAAQGQAERSFEVVGRAIGAINDISKSSAQIGQIIGVIDEIAFQTNLLALNAGVEAARAGESGRGFAVVASEVRALAQRSAEAAKEIKGLITASSGLVEQGVDLVGRTGQALSEIKVSVTQITTVVAEISEAAREQATGLREINMAIAQMDKVTQQNAAMVEEATAATHSLAGDTADLVGVIQGFDLDDARRTNAPLDLDARRKEKIGRLPKPAVRKVVNASYAPQGSVDPNEEWTEF